MDVPSGFGCKELMFLSFSLYNKITSLYQELANATGNILENTELLASLNKTKESSTTITDSLVNSQQLQLSLDKVTTDHLLVDVSN